MVLYVLRSAFVLLAASVAALYVLPFQEEQKVQYTYVVLMLGASAGLATAIVAVDMFVRQKRLAALSGVFLGLVGGLVVAFALSLVVDLIARLAAPVEHEEREAFIKLLEGVKVFIGLITCYLGISLVIQTKDDFRFVIPYVEFAKQVRGLRPTLLDSSVLIDGRIVDIVNTRIMQGTLVVPRFILNELQLLADSSDKLRRARGRRGLETVQNLQANPIIEVHVDDTEAEGGTVDQKLVTLTTQIRGRLMTNDFNLSKVAAVRGLDVINLNELAKSMRPVVLPGELMTIKIIKPGESPSQGVGYLEDGTMVVVENARSMINQEVDLAVTSTLQTSAGRMIFGRLAQGNNRSDAEDTAETAKQ